MTFLELSKWASQEQLERWKEAGVTRAVLRGITEEAARAHDHLMAAARNSADPEVRRAWERHNTLSQVIEGLQNTRSDNGSSE